MTQPNFSYLGLKSIILLRQYRELEAQHHPTVYQRLQMLEGAYGFSNLQQNFFSETKKARSNGRACLCVGRNLFRHLFEEQSYFISVADGDRFEAALQLINKFVITKSTE